MSWLSRLINTVRAGRLQDDLDEELSFHVESRAEELVARGLPRHEAERTARARLGVSLARRDESRDVRLLPRLDALLQDLRYGWRVLWRHPLATGAAILSLGLATGAATAAFSLVDALVLRSLGVRAPEQLVYVAMHSPRTPDENQIESFNYRLFQQLRDASDGHAELFGVSYPGVHPVRFDPRQPKDEPVGVQWISARAFGALGVTARIGRVLVTADDAAVGLSPVAVISHRFWVRRFGADPSVVGRWCTIEKRPFQIVGVARQGFDTLEPGTRTDMWVPLTMGRPESFADSGWQWFRVWGRLGPHETSERLGQRLQPVVSSFLATFVAERLSPETPPETVRRIRSREVTILPAGQGPSQTRRLFARPLAILASLVALVLLIACANVASLLVARASSREREMGLRVSIGAGRGRLVQQMLVESGLLVALAAALGFVVAKVMAPLIVDQLSTADNPIWLDLRTDARVWVFTIVLCGLTTALCGLLPAWRASYVSPHEALTSGGGRSTSHLRALGPLVSAQAGFGIVVLFVASLLLGSFHRLVTIDPGFAAKDVLVASVEATGLDGPSGNALQFPAGSMQAATPAVRRQLLDTIRRAPGVAGASLSAWPLFKGWSWDQEVRIPGRAPETRTPYFLAVSPGFFDTMRIRRIAGRDFTDADAIPEKPPAVVVNEAFARHYFGRLDIVGQTFDRLDREGPTRLLIVGIVGNSKYNDLREAWPATVYVPARGLDGAALQVRTAGDPLALAAELESLVTRVHPSLRVTEVTRQGTMVSNTIVRERLMAMLAGFFGIVALVLAATGIYAVLSYAVVQRTREIGIRMALGARAPRVVGLLVGRVAVAVGFGLVVGLGGGLAAARFVASVLYEITPTDPRVAAVAVLVLVAAGIGASVPAVLRAVRLDPIEALRYE